MFKKAFVINLAFKEDRLSFFRAQKELESVSESGQIEVWPAIHGDTCRAPSWWTAGNGAWGCYRSHMAILEHCMNTGVESYCVFEDDALMREGFRDEFKRSYESLPNDWEQFYLGGQLYYEWSKPPVRISDHCYMPFNVNRTHGFAVHRRGYGKLYSHLWKIPYAEHEHIDHHLGRLHESRGINVYCPARWLVGQSAGASNISGQTTVDTFWHDPETLSRDHPLYKSGICVVLLASIEVAVGLQLRGFHQGNWKNDDGIDRGVIDALNSPYPATKLNEWFDTIRREVVRDGHFVPCLYHPSLTRELLSRWKFANFIVVEPTAATVTEQIDEAMAEVRSHRWMADWLERYDQIADVELDQEHNRNAHRLERRVPCQ